MKQTNRIFFIVLAILLPLLCGGSVFFLTRNVPAACIVLGLSALQVLFTAWQRHREQAYWRSVAAQLLLRLSEEKAPPFSAVLAGFSKKRVRELGGGAGIFPKGNPS